MIEIKFNPNGDSRTLDHEPTNEEIIEARHDHASNVEEVMTSIADIIYNKGIEHDFTVEDHMDEFCKLIQKAYRGEINFTDSNWWNLHITKERHHLEAHIPEDANLMDLIECIVDRTVASKERGQAAGEINIDKDSVYKMFLNTIDYLKEHIKVVK